MPETDAARAQREAAELGRMATAILDDPGSAPPEVTDRSLRTRLRLWEKPSFADHRSWTVWGPHPGRDVDRGKGLPRRLIWRQEFDLAPRFDPVRRLHLIDEPLRPTVEMTDATVDLERIEDWPARLPAPKLLGSVLRRAQSFSLDGERYGLQIDDHNLTCRYEWFWQHGRLDRIGLRI